MLNLKKTAVAVLALGSSAVFAGSMGPVCSAVNVTVPCESTAWEFGAKAIYLKAQTGDNSGFSPVFDSNQYVDHAPNYNWGFQIEGAYHFNTGNDFKLNWYHLNHSSQATIGAQPVSAFNAPAGLGGATTTTINGASKSIDPKWDAVNIEVGQHVDFGDNKAIRFHGGAQYARVANDIKTSSNVSYTAADPVVALTSYASANNYEHTYNGFGPRVGMDLSYDWGNGLGIYANGATALLAGTRSYSNVYTDTTNSIASNLSRTAIVPVMDAKLGATYTYAMAQGDLTLDAGWMWINYFSAQSNVTGNTSDFGLQGPFVGLKWLGNIA